MANGKPGDHPVNDIIDYRLPVLSPEVDDLIRRVAKFVPRYHLFEMFEWFNLPCFQSSRLSLRRRLKG
jgi:hypothetical protein